MNLWTARINYSGADRVDISRAGCDRARKAGGETPGEFLAPSAALVFPALAAMKAAATAHERQDPLGKTCCNWHRSGGLASVPCRATTSDDGGWNDGAAAQLAAMGRKGKVNK